MSVSQSTKCVDANKDFFKQPAEPASLSVKKIEGLVIRKNHIKGLGFQRKCEREVPIKGAVQRLVGMDVTSAENATADREDAGMDRGR
eukprot:1713431-Amphidinium_carterae.1